MDFGLDRRIDMSDRRCSECNSNNTFIRPENNRPHWFHDKIGRLLCRKCYERNRKKWKQVTRKFTVIKENGRRIMIDNHCGNCGSSVRGFFDLFSYGHQWICLKCYKKFENENKTA